MAILSKGTDFSTGDQVTAANLDALVDNATFAAGAVDNTTTALDSSSPQKIIVKDGGIGTTQLATSDSTTTGVTFAKMQHVAANTVLVRDASSAGDISAKAVANTQILIGDGTGFTAAALSGDVTMTNSGAVTIADDAVDTAQIADDAVDTAQIKDDAVNSAQIATGAIDLDHMSANSVDSNQYVDGSIDAVHIASNAVTTAKIANSSNTTTGVTFAKMQHVPANTVLVRNASSEGDISAKAVTNQQILIGDGTGFTAAALSGDVTMTNSGVVNIANNVALGGNPTATTQSAGNNSTRVATTAFVTTAVAATTLTEIVEAPGDVSVVPVSGMIQIPTGYKATSAVAYGYRITVTLKVKNVNSTSSGTTLASGSTAAKTNESLGSISLNFTDVNSTSTNYLYYGVVNFNGFTDEFHGIKVNVEPI